MKEIKFYKVGDEYGNFSNFAPFPIVVGYKSWPTVEHYFQSCKFEDDSIKERIRSITSPMSAAKEGRDRKNPLRKDWESIKDSIMLESLRAKFMQHPSLRKELLQTGNAVIIMLGRLLVEIREELKLVNPNIDVILPPWLAFPEVDQKDMFWRMGLGENYLYVWSRYYLTLKNKSNYHKQFPEPENWIGFFE